MDNTFLGMNGFVWWIGVVENNNDPVKIGRCQVRIFGWHTDDKNLIPTADLPWSHAVLPINNSKSFSVPSMGDWVTGYFFDGKSGQFPAYFGVLPGVISPTVNKNPTQGFTDPSTSGATTTTPTQNIDGSGSTFTSNPYVTTPQLPGKPSTNLDALNLTTDKPLSVTQKIDSKFNDIYGPRAESLGTQLLVSGNAGAAPTPPPTGKDGVPAAGSPCGLDPNSMLGEVAGFFTSASDLLSETESYLIGLEQSAQNAVTGAIDTATSAVTGAIGSATSAVSGAVSSASNSFNSMLSDASAAVNEQIASAEKFAAEELAIAEDAASKLLTDLTDSSGHVGCTILAGLAGISPAKVTVIQPVVAINNQARIVVGSAPMPPNVTVPNVIPTETHIAHAPSNQIKSLENTVAIFKAAIVTLTIAVEGYVKGVNSSWSENIFSSGGTVDSRSALGLRLYVQNWNTNPPLDEQNMAKAYNNPNIISELETFRAPYIARVQAALSTLPSGYVI